MFGEARALVVGLICSPLILIAIGILVVLMLPVRERYIDEWQEDEESLYLSDSEIYMLPPP